MRHVFLLVVLVATGGAKAAPLFLTINLVASNVETVLTDPFGAAGPVIDVYHVLASNTNTAPATSIELNLDGPFINNFTFSQLDFQDNTSLPAPAGTPVADSFFVTPAGTVGIGRNDIDDENGVLSAAYTIQGGAEFIPAGGAAVLAVLSVPTGVFPDLCGWGGFAAIDGRLEEITFLGEVFCVPEPSTALLAAMASAGFAGRRR